MSKSLKANLIRCGITAVIGLAAAIGYAVSRSFGEQELVQQYRILCDAFTIPGALMILLGMLMSLNYLGALDTLSYLLSYAVHALACGALGRMERYVDYIEKRREDRKKGYGFLYVVGLVFLAIAVVFLVLFYTLY